MTETAPHAFQPGQRVLFGTQRVVEATLLRYAPEAGRFDHVERAWFRCDRIVVDTPSIRGQFEVGREFLGRLERCTPTTTPRKDHA